MKFATGAATVAFAAILFALTLSVLSPIDASATIEDDCVLDGGSWDGLGADDGTCTFSANSSEAVSNCGADSIYSVTYNSNTEEITPACTAVLGSSVSSESSSAGWGGCRSEVRGPLEQEVTLWPCNGKNGSATFSIGACFIKCVVASGLPGPAARKLPSNAEATLYVRVITPDWETSAYAYTVCFYVGDLNLKPPSLYRFVNGAWTLIAFGNENSQFVCANAIEDGAFYLGEPKKNKD